LRIGRERVPSPRGKKRAGRVRRPRPRPRRCTGPRRFRRRPLRRWEKLPAVIVLVPLLFG